MGMKSILHHCDHLCSEPVVLIETRRSKKCKMVFRIITIGKPGNILIITFPQISHEEGMMWCLVLWISNDIGVVKVSKQFEHS